MRRCTSKSAMSKACPRRSGSAARRIRAGLRRQLPSNIFVQFLAGPLDIRESAFGWLLQAIAWVTLVIAPVLLLLLIQTQFLPFHSSFITGAHRLALVFDLILVWWLWLKILSGRYVRSLWGSYGRLFVLDGRDISRRVAGTTFSALGYTVAT